MSDRPLTEDFYVCPTTGDLVYKWQDERMVLVTTDALRELRADVERLTAENDCFRSQFAEAAEIEALLEEHGGDLTKAGWVKSDYASECALADQLADDLSKCWRFAREYARDGQPEPPSLAAWEAARHE